MSDPIRDGIFVNDEKIIKHPRRGDIIPLRNVCVAGFLIVFLVASTTLAQDKWYATGYLQYSQGNYIFTTNTSTLYLVPGLRYQASGWNISAALPIISQNNNFITATGGTLIPHGESNMNTSSGTGGMMGNSSDTMGNMWSLVGAGDLYLSGEYDFIHPDFSQLGSFRENASPTVGIIAQVKFPTASTSHNFGTGKFDFSGSLNYRELFGTFVVMANTGYLIIGKPAGVNFTNSLTYGGGVGKFFDDGGWSVALLYQGYTTILSGSPPPNQASVGLNYKVNSDVTGTALFSDGLTKTAPDFGVIVGFRWGL